MTSLANTLFVGPGSERPPVERNERGEPVYGDSGIAAVGARDQTLGEAVDPLLVYSSDQSEPLAVQVPLSAVAAHPQLEPVLRNGVLIESESEALVQIPWPIWQEYAEHVVGIWLPERDAEGLDRALAIAVRELQFAKREVEARTLARNALVVLGSRMGRPRKEMAAAADLSVPRVQQLNEKPPHEVIELVRMATQVAILLGEETVPHGDVPMPAGIDAEEERKELVASMLAAGLLEEGVDGLRLTADGLSLCGLDRAGGASKRRKRSGDGESADDAAR